MARRSRQEPKSARDGVASIEYALILPLLLLFVLELMDVGRLLWAYTTLNRAVAAAARCAAVDTSACATAAQIQSRVAAEAWGITIDPATVSAATPACGVQVSATYDFAFVIPGLAGLAPLGTMTLAAAACYPR